ncbi:hypothetical protein [Knoellia sinensis]|nr:hypothetical protein [Knoellia sinensis]
MSDHQSGRPPLARSLSLLIAGVVGLELVFVVFLLAMGRLAGDASSSNTDRALVFGAVTSAAAALVALALWSSVRSGGPEAPLRIWAARVLPVLALAVAIVVAAFGGVPWLGAPLAFFTTAPVSIVAMVAPQLMASRR